MTDIARERFKVILSSRCPEVDVFRPNRRLQAAINSGCVGIVSFVPHGKCLRVRQVNHQLRLSPLRLLLVLLQKIPDDSLECSESDPYVQGSPPRR